MDRIKFEIEDGVAAVHLPEGIEYLRVFVGGKRIELKLDEEPIQAKTAPWTPRSTAA